MNKSQKVATNMLWRLMERFGAQLVAFIVQIVLARILAPEAYGTIALVTVFTTILNIFIDSGFGNALIQKKNADDLDFSTVFFFNICMCSVLYLLLFFFSPVIANFYDDVSLVPVIRVLGLTLIISGVKNVQQAYVSRTMQFKRFFFATLGGTLGAAILGITLAYLGFGVWALVAQQLFNATVDTIILWITVKWRPKRMFSFERLKGLFSFGWKLLVSSLIYKTYTEVRQLIIGKLYSPSDLAQYNRGYQFPNFIVVNINAAIDSVLLPAMSSEQDDKSRVRAMTRRSIKTSTYIMAPLMMGLAAMGEPLVKLILTEKWLPCVLFMQIFCISFMFYPIVGFQMVTSNFFRSIGYAGTSIFLSLTRQLIFLLPLLYILPQFFGLGGIWASMPLADLIACVVSASMMIYHLRKFRNAVSI